MAQPVAYPCDLGSPFVLARVPSSVLDCVLSILLLLISDALMYNSSCPPVLSSPPVLKFLAAHGALTVNHVDLLWSSSIGTLHFPPTRSRVRIQHAPPPILTLALGCCDVP